MLHVLSRRAFSRIALAAALFTVGAVGTAIAAGGGGGGPPSTGRVNVIVTHDGVPTGGYVYHRRTNLLQGGFMVTYAGTSGIAFDYTPGTFEFYAKQTPRSAATPIAAISVTAGGQQTITLELP